MKAIYIRDNRLNKLKKELRTAIAEYMQSEGCHCCENIGKHREDKERIAKLLGVRKYSDGSGYNFRIYQQQKGK